MAFMLGRQRNPFETEDEELSKIISNERLYEHFKQLGVDLGCKEPRHPDTIFRAHLEERKVRDADIDSAKKNLAMTYANAFVNAGFGKDHLMLTENEKESWVYKNKEGGMTAAAASLGMLLLWDTDQGLVDIDKYQEATDDYIKAGAFMAIGIVFSGIKNECDPVCAILMEQLEKAQK